MKNFLIGLLEGMLITTLTSIGLVIFVVHDIQETKRLEEKARDSWYKKWRYENG